MSSLWGLLSVFTATFATPFAAAQPAAPPPRLPTETNYVEYAVASLYRGQFSTDPRQLAQLTQEGRVASSHDFQGQPEIKVQIFPGEEGQQCTNPGDESSFRIVVENTGDALARIQDLTFSYWASVIVVDEDTDFSSRVEQNLQSLVTAEPAPQEQTEDEAHFEDDDFEARRTLVWFPQDLPPGGTLSFTVRLRTRGTELVAGERSTYSGTNFGFDHVEAYSHEVAILYRGPLDAAESPASAAYTSYAQGGDCTVGGPRNPQPAIICEVGRELYEPGHGDLLFVPFEEGCEPTLRQLVLGPRFESAESARSPGFASRRFDPPIPDIIPGDCRVAADDVVASPALQDALARRGRASAWYLRPLYDAGQDLKRLTEANYLADRPHYDELTERLQTLYRDYLTELANVLEPALTKPEDTPRINVELQRLQRRWEGRWRDIDDDVREALDAWQEERLDAFALYLCDQEDLDPENCSAVRRAIQSVSRACLSPPANTADRDGGLTEALPDLADKYRRLTEKVGAGRWHAWRAVLLPGGIDAPTFDDPYDFADPVASVRSAGELNRAWLLFTADWGARAGDSLEALRDDDVRAEALADLIKDARGDAQEELFTGELAAYSYQPLRIKMLDEVFRRDVLEVAFDEPKEQATACERERSDPRGFAAPTENSVEFPSITQPSEPNVGVPRPGPESGPRISYCESNSQPNENVIGSIQQPVGEGPENEAAFNRFADVQRGDKQGRNIPRGTLPDVVDTHFRAGGVFQGESEIYYEIIAALGFFGSDTGPSRALWGYKHDGLAISETGSTSQGGDPISGGAAVFIPPNRGEHVVESSELQLEVGRPPELRHDSATSSYSLPGLTEIDFLNGNFNNLPPGWSHADSTSQLTFGTLVFTDRLAERHNSQTSLYWQVGLNPNTDSFGPSRNRVGFYLIDKLVDSIPALTSGACSPSPGQAWWANDCSCDCGQHGLYLNTTTEPFFQVGAYCAPAEGFYTTRGANAPAEFPIDPGYDSYPLEPRLDSNAPGGEVFGPNQLQEPQSAAPGRLLGWLEPLTNVTWAASAESFGEPRAAATSPPVNLWQIIRTRIAGLRQLLWALRAQVAGADADLDVYKSDVGFNPTGVGRIVVYGITVSNASSGRAEGVHIIDTLPAEVRLIEARVRQPTDITGATRSCDPSGPRDALGGTIDCDLQTITGGGFDPFTNTEDPAKEFIGIDVTVEVMRLPPEGSCLGPNQKERCIRNSVRVHSLRFDSNRANDGWTTLTPVYGADLVLTKKDEPDPVKRDNNPDPNPQDEELVYTLEVRNDGPHTAYGVLVTDQPPASVLYKDNSDHDKCGDPPPQPVAVPFINCAFGDLEPNDPPQSVTITVLPKASGKITNIADAYVTNIDLQANPPRPTEADPSNNRAQDDDPLDGVQTTVLGKADLEIRKEDDDDDGPKEQDTDTPPDQVRAGGAITYTIEVKNNGPDPAVDVVVTDTLPNNVVPAGENSVQVTPQGVCTKLLDPVTQTVTRVECKLDELAPNATFTATVTFRIKEDAPAGLITNLAKVDAETDDPDQNNNEDQEITEVIGGDGGGGGGGCPAGAICGPPDPGGVIQPIDGGGFRPPGAWCVHFISQSQVSCTTCPLGQTPIDSNGDGILDACGTGEPEAASPTPFPPDEIKPNLQDPSASDASRILWHDIFITSRTECLASFQGEHHLNREDTIPDREAPDRGIE